MNIKQYTYKNKEEINDIYIHDSYFADINLSINNKKIYITLEGEYLKNKSCSIILENVIHFEFDRLALWGGEENRILDIYLEKNDNAEEFINNKVKKEQEECSSTIIEFAQEKNIFINVCIKTNTGDVTSIICEKMALIDE